MIPSARKLFNEQYSSKKNLKFQYLVQRVFDFKPDFNVLETPVFISDILKEQLVEASLSIIEQLKKTSYRMIAHQAIPSDWVVPDEDAQPLFLQFDFAITQDRYHQPTPKLIEMQGFPALFFFQHAAWWAFQSTYELDRFTPYFEDRTTSEYVDVLRKAILGNCKPEETILLEINPWRQRTTIDFAGARALLDIPICDIEGLEREGKKLYYRNARKEKVQVKRIFNRVILEELFQQKYEDLAFNLLQEVDVEWAGHPNWFLKYSKFALPFLQGDFVPKSFLLKEWTGQENLKNFVLKPIHSFAGNGVLLNPTQKDIDSIKNKSQYILQRKVEYAPILISPKGNLSKLEIRILLIWNAAEQKYNFMTTLVRASRTNQINTQYSAEEKWTGGGIGLFNV